MIILIWFANLWQENYGFLDNYTGADIDVCSFIKEKFSDTLYENGEIFLSSGKQTPSSNSLFLGSCVLVNKDINHSIIKKNNVGTYNYFHVIWKMNHSVLMR